MIELRRRYSGGKGSDSPSFSRLPAGYQEVEYLESTGTQYIKTGVIYNKDEIATIEIDCMLVQKNDIHNSCPYGFYRGNVSSSVSTEFSIGGVLKISASALYDIIEQPVYESLKRHRVVVNGKDGTSINGSVLDSSIHKIIETTLEIPLFTRNPNGGNLTLEVFKGKIYCCKFYKDYKIIRDFVPCYRTTDRVAGMYDIVNDVFYTNAGTGEFLVGADVGAPKLPSEYQEVEYLESDGHSYLEIPFDNVRYDDRIKVGFKSTNASAKHIFGSSFVNGNATMVAMYYLSGENASIFRWFIYQTQNNMIDIRPHNKYDVEIQYPTLKMTNNDTQNVNEYQLKQITSETLYSSYFTLFTAIFNGKPNGTFTNGQIFYFEDEGKINLIPCYRKADNVAGMYDLVSGEFYTNAGTGEFTVGADVIG